MKKILIGTNNLNKVKEFKLLFKDTSFKVITPSQLKGLSLEVEETGQTFTQNAVLKAKFFGESSGLICLADDSGLEVVSLGCKPGVYSKRYAHSDGERIRKLLDELKNIKDRKARFVCVIALYDPTTKKLKTIQGESWGDISTSPKGKGGFGYDPIFIPNEGDGRTYAQMSKKEKALISHRGKAFILAADLINEI